MSGYLGDAANAKNHRYGRTWVAMFSVTVPGQICKRESAKEHVVAVPALGFATCPFGAKASIPFLYVVYMGIPREASLSSWPKRRDMQSNLFEFVRRSVTRLSCHALP